MSQTILLDQESIAILDGVAARNSISRQEALTKAIHEYAAYDKWACAEIEAGLKEAEAGDLIPNEAVNREMSDLLKHIAASRITNAG